MYLRPFRRSFHSTDYVLHCEEFLSSTQSYLSVVAQDTIVKFNARRLSPVLLEIEFKDEGWPLIP